MSTSKSNGIQTELSRDLGLTSALAIGIGTMIAAGIFTLSGLAIRNVGSGAILAFLLAAIAALFTALTYCEFVSIYPRSGEGYLYARKTYSPPLAYLVGWCLFLGYTSSCAFYIASLSSYFQEFIMHLPIESLSGIIFLISLTLINMKGTKESGGFQVVVTIAKVLLLIWFIAGGIQFVELDVVIDKFNSDVAKIGSTAALVFITFFGFSAIAASAGEVINPVKNIPRAIFISMGVVTILYTLVVLVVLFGGITEYDEKSMGAAAMKFLGPVGGNVIIAGAIFSMISASNASIMAGSRVTLSMSQLGHLPKIFGFIHASARTPMVSLILVGGMILLFAIAAPLEPLANFSNTVLLSVLILVNAALIIHRRKHPDMVRPFRVPLVPLLPILGILANLYLLSQIAMEHPMPMLSALGSLVIGMVGFLVWKGTQSPEDALPGTSSKVAIGQYSELADDKTRFRILVPLANPDTIERLIDLAAGIAHSRNGEIILLRVAVIPEQLATGFYDPYVEQNRAILEQSRDYVRSKGLPVTSLVRIGHNAARAILETSKDHDCDLIVMGWKGFSTTGEKILGDITDAVVTNAHADIMMVRFVGNAKINRILLPTAGGEHAQLAERYAAELTDNKKGKLTVCRVTTDKNTASQEKNKTDLAAAVTRLEKWNSDANVISKTIDSESIVKGIVDESKNHDAVIVGATRKSIYPQIMFGNIPEEIAKSSNKTVIMVKNYNPVKALLGRVMGE